jgi:hypothetical protein
MKLDTFKTTTTEIFVEGHGVTVTANPWSNCEGVSFMLHGKDGAIRLAGTLRWEELDVLMVALTAARA